MTVPQRVQSRMWKVAENHVWVHYALHMTACLVRDVLNGNSYPFYSPPRWLERSHRINVTGPCPKCGGTGYTTGMTIDGQNVKLRCDNCDGSGNVQRSVQPCPFCKGSGRKNEITVEGKPVVIVCPECGGSGEGHPPVEEQAELPT